MSQGSSNTTALFAASKKVSNKLAGPGHGRSCGSCCRASRGGSLKVSALRLIAGRENLPALQAVDILRRAARLHWLRLGRDRVSAFVVPSLRASQAAATDGPRPEDCHEATCISAGLQCGSLCTAGRVKSLEFQLERKEL